MMDARWNEFGAHLGVDAYTREIIDKSHKGADCMLHLVSMWWTNLTGTGNRPRSWETVVRAVKATGVNGLAEELAALYRVAI